jgi:hypothetical protein
VSPWFKLLTGIAATGLIANLAYGYESQALLAKLGTEAAIVMAANGVTDGAARWTNERGWPYRVARLSGTADAATRARISAQLSAQPGIHAVIWQDRAQ